MRNLIFLIIAIFIISCEKDSLKNEEIPNWLKTRIAQDEEQIRNDPQSGLDCAAWIRYKYDNKHYFVYDNILSSSGPMTYDYDGSKVYFGETVDDYINNRCCKLYIWKGPTYID